MALGGMTGSTYAAPHHHMGERIRRCAEEVLQQLTAECRVRRIERLTIIAPQRFMGELRKLCDTLEGCIVLREGELMQFSTAALAVHPMIRELVGG